MKVSKRLKLVPCSIVTALLAFSTSLVFADTYEISVTNVTRAQAFTPRLAITHSTGSVFTPGEAAIEELVAIAEGGDLAPMTALSNSAGDLTTDLQVGEGLLNPGETQTITIAGNSGDLLTLLSMLIPTNDGFIGLNAVALPATGSITYNGMVYDAGSETNDESCANIPGPVCGGDGPSPADDGEGYIHVHSGIHGTADLAAATYDWKNPAVIIKVSKL